jgi:hypothetical protein
MLGPGAQQSVQDQPLRRDPLAAAVKDGSQLGIESIHVHLRQG